MASTPAFVIFQGGGASGVSHVGGIAAAEAFGMRLIGCGGASAGAIVAALVAVGHSAEEIFSVTSKTNNVVARQQTDATSVLGQEQWHELGRVGHMLRSGWLGRLRCLWPAWRIFRTTRAGRGYFETSRFATLVNGALREKLQDHWVKAGIDRTQVPETICFRHIDPGLEENARIAHLIRPLKVVVTDVGSQAAVLLGTADPACADVPVGLAVAASAAIPVFFRPVSMSIDGAPSRDFVDGGLVSNLPVWIFAEERLDYERRHPNEPVPPVLAFILQDMPAVTPAMAAKPGFFGFVATILRTGIAGSQKVALRNAADIVPVVLRSPLGTLDFDADWATLRGAVEAGRLDATQVFNYALRLKPQGFEKILGDVIAQARTALEAASGPLAGTLRAALLLPQGRLSLRVAYSTFAGQCPDDRLVIALEGEGVGTAWRAREPVVIDAEAIAQGIFAQHATRTEQALVWQALRTSIAVPIFVTRDAWTLPGRDRPTPRAVLVLDSDEDLTRFDLNGVIIDPILIEFSANLSDALAKADVQE